METVAELLAEMAVEVMLPALLPPRSRSTAVLAASIASPCEHSHTLFLVRLDGQRMSQRCATPRCQALVDLLAARRQARAGGRVRFEQGDGCASRRCSADHRPAKSRRRQLAMAAALQSTHVMVSACAVVSPARVASDFPGFGFFAHAPQARSAVQRASALGSRSRRICPLSTELVDALLRGS